MTDQPPRRISLWFALIPGVAVAVLLTLGTPLVIGQRDDVPSALIDRPAPAFNFEPIAGQPKPDSALLTDGRPMLVNFWASWCAPCRIEHPHLMKLAAEGLTIVGLNYRDDDADALRFISELGNPYMALGSVDGRSAVDWGVYGVPETYLIDGAGKIKLRIAGPVTQQVLDRQLLPALKTLEGS
ncbi:MAG: DsbE family thiol:disulfide interchange protein [Pseudomonadota bacterium]